MRFLTQICGICDSFVRGFRSFFGGIAGFLLPQCSFVRKSKYSKLIAFSIFRYEDVIKLKDFTVGWRNGLAFNAIIHSHRFASIALHNPNYDDPKFLIVNNIFLLYILRTI